jgi:hypothetical protein
VSTANQTISRRDTSDIETLLAAVFRSQPASATLAEIDRRVAAALDTWTPMPTGFVDRFARSRRRMVLLGVAGFLLVGAGGVSLIGTYESFWGGGFRTAWDRATKINQSVVLDRYRVTIERAYVDRGQLMVAASVVDEGSRPETQVELFGVRVTDGLGRTWFESGGGSTPVGATEAANAIWLRAPQGSVSGMQTFHVSLSIATRAAEGKWPDPSNPWVEIPGPWAFDIEVPLYPGDPMPLN